MITKVLINSTVNLMFNSVLIFFILYLIIYGIFKDKIKENKILKLLLITLVIIISLVISSNSDVRKYRKYTIDYKEVTIMSFFSKAVNDYIDGDTINISTYNIQVLVDSLPGPKGRPKNDKINYLDIDNGKYIIPIDIKNKGISTFLKELNSNQGKRRYSITVYKNTMLVKSIENGNKGDQESI